VNKFRKHFDELCAELNVDMIRVVDSEYPDDPWGFALLHPYDHTRRAVILSHTPNGPMSYMVGLHELGHCVRGPGWSADLEMDRECAAWRWALENAKYVSPERQAQIALVSLDRSAALPGVIQTKEYTLMRRRLQRVIRG
jgi:hypothetical protein